MRILITGATGFIGGNLTSALLAAGHQVRCAVRSPEAVKDTHPEAEAVHVDFMSDHSAVDWLPHLQGVDAVINAVGIIAESKRSTFEALHTKAPSALFDACKNAGVRRVVQISALGADEQATAAYHLSKKAADDHLRSLDLDWVIVQPSVVFGTGGASTAMFRLMATLPLVPLIGKGQQQLQPIHISDLVKGVTALAAGNDTDANIRNHETIRAVGSGQISFKEMLLTLRGWLGIKNRLALPIPMFVMNLTAKVMDRVGSSPMNSEAMEMLERGNTGDSKEWQSVIGHTPKSFATEHPASGASRNDKNATFLSVLGPLLRISIAFIWIITGIVSAFIFPAADSFALLADAGISGDLASLSLYGTSGLEILLGISLLAGYKVRLVGLIQLALILGFTTIITINLPHLWAEPFGPITKNIPIIAATLVMMSLAND